MGCVDSRANKSQAECTLEVIERNLLFHLNSSSDIDSYIRKYSFQGQINEHHWAKIILNLNLNYTSDEIKDFYSQFKTPDDKFSVTQLLVLGILNGEDTQEIKAKLLFEVIDTFDSKVLDTASLRLLYDLIFETCVVKVRSLVKVVNQKERESECLEFLDKIVEKNKRFQKWFSKTFLGKEETVTLNRFVTCFRDEVEEGLLTPAGFRRVMKEFKAEHRGHKHEEEVKEVEGNNS